MKLKELRKIMVGEIYSEGELESLMETENFFPIEQDDEEEEGILKYTNYKSQIWLKYTKDESEYLIENVTRCTKKNGPTQVRAFRSIEEIRGMLMYFRDNEEYDAFLIFVLGCLLARRVGDTVSLKWSDLYHENGVQKSVLDTLVEAKTDKIVRVKITDITWKYVDWYCRLVKINPMEHFNDDIFLTSKKRMAANCQDPVERKRKYNKAMESLIASYRYKFKKASSALGIEGVSTHSTRKTFGYLAHLLNKYDPDCLFVLQSILGHESIEMTKIYIDIVDEKATKMFEDVSCYIRDADKGILPAIDNTPIITLRTNDLRDVLIAAYRYGQNGKNDEMGTLNRLLSIVDEKRVS